jgi:predicted TIM-barrel fold metal-dependent hydrolase
MFESDFPHTASLTPNGSQDYVKGPRDTILDNLVGLPETLVRKLLSDNAARVYAL